jgi:hypothetical protein
VRIWHECEIGLNEVKVNMEHQLDATITVLIDLQDQLNMFRSNFCPSLGAQD